MNNVKASPNRIFDLELNIVGFLSPVIIMLIFMFTKEANIGTLITAALTFAFTAYMLKLTRAYEQSETDIDIFMKTLIFPRKNEIKNYFAFLFVILLINFFTLGMALIAFYGFELYEQSGILKTMLVGYYVSLALVGCAYFSMLIVFDFMINIVLYMKINFTNE